MSRTKFAVANDSGLGWTESFIHGRNEPLPEGVHLDDFYAYMPMHSFIFAPSREMWPASSINGRIQPVEGSDGKKVKPSAWLDSNRPVEQMTWAPGEPMLIRDRLVSEGGWIDRRGVTCFNLYRAPTLLHGCAEGAAFWVDHVHTVFGDDADHIIKWLAHRVQRPHEKINHALVLGGAQGIGKDTMLEPVKRAIGPWNFSEVSPQQMLGRFNGYLKSVILRVSEARDLGEVNRYQFYDHTKAYIAAPPDTLRVDEKHLREHSIFNAVGVIITTNHKCDGIFLPADDRRHFIAWSELTKENFSPAYWNRTWSLIDSGGDRDVAAYLAQLDLSHFDPKAPPPKTAAFWDIVNANRAPEDGDLADAIEAINGKDKPTPDALTIAMLKQHATGDFFEWISDRKNRRQIPHRFEQCGYTQVNNDAAKDGQFKINDKRQTVYAKSSLSGRDRFAAANKLTKREDY